MLEFISTLWNAIIAALTFDVSTLLTLAHTGGASTSIFSIAILAGFGQLIGNSVVLLVHHVTRPRLLVTLLVDAFQFAGELLFWAVSIWLIAQLVYGETRPLGLVLALVCLGSAPLVFGFWIVIPYLGKAMRWFLRGYSWVVTLLLIRVEYDFGVLAAVVCTLTGWLLIEVLRAVFAGPWQSVRDAIWGRLTGAPGIVTFEHRTAELSRRLRAGR